MVRDGMCCQRCRCSSGLSLYMALTLLLSISQPNAKTIAYIPRALPPASSANPIQQSSSSDRMFSPPCQLEKRIASTSPS